MSSLPTSQQLPWPTVDIPCVFGPLVRYSIPSLGLSPCFSITVHLTDAGGPGVISGQLIIKEIMRRLGHDLRMDRRNPPLPSDHADIMVGAHLGACVPHVLSFLSLALTRWIIVSRLCSWVDYAFLRMMLWGLLA